MNEVKTFDITDEQILKSIPDTAKVKNHLLVKGRISSWEAIRLYGITRLSAVIYELRHKEEPPMDIRNEWKTGEDRFGQHTRWVEYFI